MDLLSKLNLTLVTRICKETVRKKHQNLSSTDIHDNKQWVTLYFILTGIYRSLLIAMSRYTPLELIVTHIFLNTRYAVCHIMPLFNPDTSFSYCSLPCSQEHWEKHSGQATNKQVGCFYIYISNRSTHWTNLCLDAKGTTEALRRRWSLFARFVLKRQPTPVPAARKPFTTEWHTSLQPPEVRSSAASSRPWGNSSQTTARVHLPALLINSATSIN